MLTPEMCRTLALNIKRRAAQIAEADAEWVASIYWTRLVELDYELESAGSALDRHNGIEED